jgi:5'-phosphate synthase pdxT subunit
MLELCQRIKKWRREVGEDLHIGVLALQGDYAEHINMLHSNNADVSEIRLPSQLDDIDGLIIPGGESTTIVQLIDIYDFRTKLVEMASEGFPIWGTCAGMIVMARELTDHRPDPLNLMNIKVSRNAFGRQIDSFEEDLTIKGIEGKFPAVFIRAPIVVENDSSVDILCSIDKPSGPVAVQQGKLLATSFHPELTNDSRMHEYFLSIVKM